MPKSANNLPCPECGGITKVTDSRKHPLGVYRRRKCVNCDYKISTIEMINSSNDYRANIRKLVADRIRKMADDIDPRSWNL